MIGLVLLSSKRVSTAETSNVAKIFTHQLPAEQLGLSTDLRFQSLLCWHECLATKQPELLDVNIGSDRGGYDDNAIAHIIIIE